MPIADTDIEIKWGNLVRIVPATLVFLAALSFSTSAFIGTGQVAAKQLAVSSHRQTPSKSRRLLSERETGNSSKAEKKPVDSKPDANARVFIYKQTGGFIGAHRKYEKNLADLGSDERRKLEKLIADSGLLNPSRKGEFITAAAADMFEYDFTFKDGATQHHVVYDDGTLPDSFRPLTQFCKDKMVDLPRR